MIINNENPYISEEIYLHDSVFDDIIYNYLNRTIEISFNSYFLKKTYNFTFKNVLCLSVQSCELWGPSDRVAAWEIMDDNSKFINEIKSNKYYDEKTSYPMEEFIGILFQLVSGDEIYILCESISIAETYIE